MAKEIDKNTQNTEGTSGNNNTQNNTTETKKEFFLIRIGKKAIGGCKKVASTVNGFVHKHPYVSAGIATGVGYAAKMGVDYFTGRGGDDEEIEIPALPEAEDEPIEIGFELADDPEETTTSEE